MGSQLPSVRECPEYIETDGYDAVKVLSAGKLHTDQWQSNILCDWMGRTDEDMWSSPTCGMSIPRQNGKTLVTVGRMVSGCILYGEWVIYTAHLQKTATETFLEIRSLLESKGLEKFVREIKSAIGREQILLHNGGRIMFVARTRNGGRGLHGDCLIFDEAQELTTEQQASFLPALAASKNPQTIYLGTPPDENCTGTVFRNIRDRVVKGESKNVSWTEFSVPEIGNVSDRSRWASSNPALGIRILETTVASECEQMDPDTFARERLGWWPPIASERIEYAINRQHWESCSSEIAKPEGKTAYGVKFSADGMFVSLSGAVCPVDGPARISLIRKEPMSYGVQWLADWLNERSSKACCVVIDGKNSVDYLIEKIKPCWRFKNSIVRASTSDVIASASQISNELAENTVTWFLLQEELNNSATTSTKRPIAGGWGFGGDNPTPIEACSLALWGCRTSRRNPNRKQRIG